MASPLTADQIIKALKAEGVSVQEYKSWRSHDRNHKGAWGPVHGVVIHHTVSSVDDSSVALCYNGHSTLPGPLCHAVGRNDGKVALVSAGRANHAGLGDGDVLRAVINEASLPPENETDTDGNRHFYGLEIVNLGNGTDTYPWVQYVAAVRWATALCRAHGWSERSVIGHKEWQPGKIDPYGPVVGPNGTSSAFSMTRFRADVGAALHLPAGQWQGKKEEEDMTPEQAEQLRKVYEQRFVAPWTYKNEAIETRDAYAIMRESNRRIVAIEAKLDGLAVGGIDLDALAAKVADLLAARLAN